MDHAVARHGTNAAAQGGPVRHGYTITGLTLRIAITIVVIAATIVPLAGNRYELPFHLDQKARFWIVIPRAGIPLPVVLEPGAHIVFADQTLPVRAVLIDPVVPAGHVYTLIVRRAGGTATIPFQSIKKPRDGPLLFAIDVFTILAILILGLAALWRGRDWSAWGLALFALPVLIGSAVGEAPLPPFFNLVASGGELVLTGPLTFIGLYLSSRSLAGRSDGGRGLWVFATLAFVMICCEFSGIPMVMLAGRIVAETALNLLGGSLAAIMLAVPLINLATGYRHAKPEQRLRIRWVATGTLLLIPLLVTSFLQALWLSPGSEASVLVAAFRAVLTAVIFGVYAFAVLATRLVEVRFVINRAVVFTLLMGLVVGLLALVESLIENSALHGGTGLALEVAAPLILGIAFDQIQRRIEQVVDRIFFRAEHKARETLHDFVRDAGFVEQADILVERMVAVFDRHSGGHGAVLYEARAALFERSAQHGHRWPESLDGDDPALVRLRATLAPLDLHGLESDLGAEGLALPLALRGRLFGVLVCGPRSASRYAQAEMTELGRAARDVGASLFALRARANEALVERLAQGLIPAQQAEREARQLSGLA